jgi:hypothetical protein
MWISKRRLKKIENKLERLEELAERITDIENKGKYILVRNGNSDVWGFNNYDELSVVDAIEKIMAHLKLKFKVNPEKSKSYEIIKTKKK